MSGLVLLFLAPPLTRVSLWFGPPEYFLIALLGLCAIASVAFGPVLRGLVSGPFGLLLSTFGIDTYSDFPRYTFDAFGLESGFGILPAIISLFAFAQGLELYEGTPYSTMSGGRRLSWNIWPWVSEIVRLRWSLLRGWASGLALSIVPAAGGSVAQWIAYAWKIRRARPGHQFGRGELKGLAATEGSNNGVTGTSLIPLSVLGVPGGISATIIVGALMIHGLQPELRLFKNNSSVIHTIMWGLILVKLLMGVVAAVLACTMAYLTMFPRGILAP